MYKMVYSYGMKRAANRKMAAVIGDHVKSILIAIMGQT